MNRKNSALLSLQLLLAFCSAQGFTINLAEMNQQLFTCIYKTNAWGCPESASGPGSSMEQTDVIRAALPLILKELNIKVLLDAPCGDFNWMKETDLSMLDQYIGADIVSELIAVNISRYATNAKRVFMHADITRSNLPKADAVLCRDCLPHLPYSDIYAALRNFKKSGITYLITSHYPSRTLNLDLQLAHLFNLLRYRPLNFQLEPFNFPQPLLVINEKNTEGNGNIADKSIAVWRIADLPLGE